MDIYRLIIYFGYMGDEAYLNEQFLFFLKKDAIRYAIAKAKELFLKDSGAMPEEFRLERLMTDGDGKFVCDPKDTLYAPMMDDSFTILPYSTRVDNILAWED